MWPFRKRSAVPHTPDQTPDQSTGKKVVFFHVMKTGGLTFRSLLASVYGNSFRLITDKNLAAVQADLKRSQCIEFHNMEGGQGYGHSELSRQNRWDLLHGANSFTMLRDPVDQMISTYYYARQRRVEVDQLCDANGVVFPGTLEAFIEIPENLNFQTAFFADKTPYAGEGPVTADDLTRATDLLRRLDMRVGLTDRFADSINVFETVTGRKLPGDVVQIQNRNPARPPLESVSDSLKQKIRQKCDLDVALYDLGRTMFLEDFGRCQPTRRYSFLEAAKPAAAN